MADLANFNNYKREEEAPRKAGRLRRKPEYIDIGLIFCVFALVVIGLLMIYSTSAYESGMQYGDTFFYFKKQLFGVGVGAIAMAFTMAFPYKQYIHFWRIGLIVAFAFILAIFTPLAYTANGATRWIKIMGVSIQPAEIVKLAIILYMATYLSRRDVEVNTVKGIVMSMVIPIIYCLMILLFTRNMSSAIIIGAIAAIMVFIKSRNTKFFIGMIALVAVIATIFVMIIANGAELGFRGARIKAWLDPSAYSSEEGYQTLQSLYAIGSGGLLGKGIGESVQKLGFIPEAQNDMIFAIICEELGFVGAIFVMGLFLILITRCRYIAVRADKFGGMLVTGILAQVAVQVILNIAVVTNTMPNTGISLPFISYGGTSVLFLMAEMGIVINVGKSIDVDEE